MNIAVMPGDGVGKEVIPEGLKILKAASRKFGFSYSTTDYPFGGEHYLETKQTLPDSALKELAAHDAILFGAVGVDPRVGPDSAGNSRNRNPAQDAVRAGPIHQSSPDPAAARRPHAAEKCQAAVISIW